MNGLFSLPIDSNESEEASIINNKRGNQYELVNYGKDYLLKIWNNPNSYCRLRGYHISASRDQNHRNWKWGNKWKEYLYFKIIQRPCSTWLAGFRLPKFTFKKREIRSKRESCRTQQLKSYNLRKFYPIR